MKANEEIEIKAGSRLQGSEESRVDELLTTMESTLAALTGAVQSQITLAQPLIREAIITVGESSPKAAALIIDLYPKIMPDLIKSMTHSPVHHVAYVMNHMAKISPKNILTRGVLTALFHDAKLGDADGEGKLRKQEPVDKIKEMKDAPMEKRQAAVEAIVLKAIKQRLKHEVLGAELARKSLKAAVESEVITHADLEAIAEAITIHDHVSIQDYLDLLRDFYVDAEDGLCLGSEDAAMAYTTFREKLGEETQASIPGSMPCTLVDANDALMMYFREADRAWMLTAAGVTVDLERDRAKKLKEIRNLDPAVDAERNAKLTAEINRFATDLRKLQAEKLAYNIGRHLQEVQTYARQYGTHSPEYGAYGFRGGSLYRSEDGYRLAKCLIANTTHEFGLSLKDLQPDKKSGQAEKVAFYAIIAEIKGEQAQNRSELCSLCPDP